jgi:hypothetical protein
MNEAVNSHQAVDSPGNVLVVAATPIMEFLDWETMHVFTQALQLPKQVCDSEISRRLRSAMELGDRMLVLLNPDSLQPSREAVQEAWILREQAIRLVTQHTFLQDISVFRGWWEGDESDDPGTRTFRPLIELLLPTIFYVRGTPDETREDTHESAEQRVTEEDIRESNVLCQGVYLSSMRILDPVFAAIGADLTAREYWASDTFRVLVEHSGAAAFRLLVIYVVQFHLLEEGLTEAFRISARIFVHRLIASGHVEVRNVMQFSLTVMDEMNTE